jgi:putative oxidoreductase
MLAGRAVELLGSLGLVFGFYRRFAIAGLIAFLIAATYVGHPFWLLASTPQFTPQLINFLKNLAIMGGLFYIASIDSLVSAPGFRAQPISLKQVEHAD